MYVHGRRRSASATTNPTAARSASSRRPYRHHELGPVALALVKRNVPLDARLVADTTAAAQEVVVEP
ncbi:hypothetical protein SALBM311S_01829 [Streptomyces alboniger]